MENFVTLSDVRKKILRQEKTRVQVTGIPRLSRKTQHVAKFVSELILDRNATNIQSAMHIVSRIAEGTALSQYYANNKVSCAFLKGRQRYCKNEDAEKLFDTLKETNPYITMGEVCKAIKCPLQKNCSQARDKLYSSVYDKQLIILTPELLEALHPFSHKNSKLFALRDFTVVDESDEYPIRFINAYSSVLPISRTSKTSWSTIKQFRNLMNEELEHVDVNNKNTLQSLIDDTVSNYNNFKLIASAKYIKLLNAYSIKQDIENAIKFEVTRIREEGRACVLPVFLRQLLYLSLETPHSPCLEITPNYLHPSIRYVAVYHDQSGIVPFFRPFKDCKHLVMISATHDKNLSKITTFGQKLSTIRLPAKLPKLKIHLFNYSFTTNSSINLWETLLMRTIKKLKGNTIVVLPRKIDIKYLKERFDRPVFTIDTYDSLSASSLNKFSDWVLLTYPKSKIERGVSVSADNTIEISYSIPNLASMETLFYEFHKYGVYKNPLELSRAQSIASFSQRMFRMIRPDREQNLFIWNKKLYNDCFKYGQDWLIDLLKNSEIDERC